MRLTLAAVLYIAVLGSSAHAYIGPGLGAGTIGVILGVVGSVFLALFAVVWYPLKRLIKKKKKAGATTKTDQTAAADDPK